MRLFALLDMRMKNFEPDEQFIYEYNVRKILSDIQVHIDRTDTGKIRKLNSEWSNKRRSEIMKKIWKQRKRRNRKATRVN